MRKVVVAWLRRPRYRLGCLLMVPLLVAGLCWLRVKTAPWLHSREICRACLCDVVQLHSRPFGDWLPFEQEWTRSTPGSRLLARHFGVRCRMHEGIPPMSAAMERQVGESSGIMWHSWHLVDQRERWWDDRITALFAKVPNDEDEDRALLIACLVQPDWQYTLSVISRPDLSEEIWRHLMALSYQQPPAEIRRFQDLLPQGLERSVWRRYMPANCTVTAELVARR